MIAVGTISCDKFRRYKDSDQGLFLITAQSFEDGISSQSGVFELGQHKTNMRSWCLGPRECR